MPHAPVPQFLDSSISLPSPSSLPSTHKCQTNVSTLKPGPSKHECHARIASHGIRQTSNVYARIHNHSKKRIPICTDQENQGSNERPSCSCRTVCSAAAAAAATIPLTRPSTLTRTILIPLLLLRQPSPPFPKLLFLRTRDFHSR